MSSQVNVHEAKTHLSALLERVMRGEEIIIARAGTPVARLSAIGDGGGRARVPGARLGGMWMADDFTEDLPADFLIREAK